MSEITHNKKIWEEEDKPQDAKPNKDNSGLSLEQALEDKEQDKPQEIKNDKPKTIKRFGGRKKGSLNKATLRLLKKQEKLEAKRKRDEANKSSSNSQEAKQTEIKPEIEHKTT